MNKPIISLCLLALTPGLHAGVFPDFAYAPPATWDGELFVLSQDYPDQMPPSEEGQPWRTIDFKTSQKEYMAAILDYCFEGNIAADFKPAENEARQWFHAPWLHYGNNGREFVKGLTGERRSRPFELSAQQTTAYRNFAVGFYNAPGGYAIGRVWDNPTLPNPAVAQFPEGSVSFKLLFTTAPASEVPYLQGSPEWMADIDRSSSVPQIKATRVRLLQIDIAVKDPRAGSGWVFGTFHYDATMGDADPWKNLRPLALVWGNDPTLTESQYNAGSRPADSWVNPDSPIVIYRNSPPAGANPPRVLGWAGRGNGQVDNPISSCLSCHMTAQIPARSPMVPPPNTSEQNRLRWFRDLPAGTSFDSNTASLDFSLQLGVGIQNFQRFQEMVANMGGFRANDNPVAAALMEATEQPSRNWNSITPQQYRFGRDPDEK
jgi:hypothetical protein